MAYNVPALEALIDKFDSLPSVGRKSAQRIAFHILEMDDEQVKAFCGAITDAHEHIHCCKICQTLTDGDVCSVCADNGRDKHIICVVESPQDVMAFERTGEYNGTYHVLHGLISPMDGTTPDKLKIKELLYRVANEEITEVIMATNPTVEGEATAMYLSKLLKPFNVKCTRLAYGIPVGGSLEYADEVTLMRSLEGRNDIE